MIFERDSVALFRSKLKFDDFERSGVFDEAPRRFPMLPPPLMMLNKHGKSQDQQPEINAFVFNIYVPLAETANRAASNFNGYCEISDRPSDRESNRPSFPFSLGKLSPPIRTLHSNLVENRVF